MAAVNSLIDQFSVMPLKNKLLLLVSVAIALTAIVMFFSMAEKADYQLLYSNLTEEDAGLIIQKLKEQKIPYKASSGGVMVPSDRVYDLRLQLASAGLPQGGGVGYEVFDKTSFTMTDFVQKLNYRRAVQGEIARTIRSLSEVEQCRVHLAIPEKSLFSREDDRPKASVLVKLKPGRRLAETQVHGIVHLVSSSVERLDPKDVSVVDNRGEMLTSATNDKTGMTEGQLEYQRNIEKDMENKVMSILDPVVGKGKVRVKVSTTIDFTRVEKTEERFDPDGQVIRSEQKNIEKSTTGKTGGVPGTSSNLPAKTTQQAASTQGQAEKRNETTNYEISRTTSHIVNASGNIKRLSVVALVDGIYTAQKDSNEKKYSPRAEDDLKKFESMVKNAVGFLAERGDEVRVVNMPFETAPQEEMTKPEKEILPVVLAAVKYVVPVIGLILLFLFVVKPLMKTATTMPRIPAPALPQLPQTVAEIERSMELGDKSAQGRVIKWARTNPKEATNMVKAWLEEK